MKKPYRILFILLSSLSVSVSADLHTEKKEFLPLAQSIFTEHPLVFKDISQFVIADRHVLYNPLILKIKEARMKRVPPLPVAAIITNAFMYYFVIQKAIGTNGSPAWNDFLKNSKTAFYIVDMAANSFPLDTISGSAVSALMYSLVPQQILKAWHVALQASAYDTGTDKAGALMLDFLCRNGKLSMSQYIELYFNYAAVLQIPPVHAADLLLELPAALSRKQLFNLLEENSARKIE